MEIGLIGKPSSGKSSFFKAATMNDVDIDARPFTTIKPNVGIAYVTVDCIEKEFNVKCNPKHGKCVNGKRYIPVKLWDIAGLVPDAHLGKGLGLKFLDDIRQADVLIHVVDISGKTDAEGNPTNNYDPSKDIEFVENEIDEWFYEIIKRAIEKYNTKIRTSKIDLKDVLHEQLSGLNISKEVIAETIEKVGFDDLRKLAVEIRKMSKPIIIAANKIDVNGSEKNYDALKQKHQNIIPVSSLAEIILSKLSFEGKIDYNGKDFKIIGNIDENMRKALDIIKNMIGKYGSTGVQDCLNKAVFDLLGYIVVYPVADANKLTDNKNNILPDAFIVKRGIKLKEFAYIIHTDIGDKFIGGIDARKKIKLSGDYELKNNDVIEILVKR
ncbi:MAG: redox-regulated ATPase YchF [Candidatus Aenigmatarchaeota archaeon]|nr:redox-regulated ATPase YchF [Candidatus Aenigmarchaeota archaeon]